MEVNKTDQWQAVISDIKQAYIIYMSRAQMGPTLILQSILGEAVSGNIDVMSTVAYMLYLRGIFTACIYIP